MKSLFKTFIILFTLFSFVFLFFNNIEISLFFNPYHNFFLDKFCYFISFLGDKYVFFLITFLVFLVKKKKTVAFGLSFANYFFLVQFLKRIAFRDHLRPSVVLTNLFPDIQLNFVSDVVLKKNFSFPSGHATIIFSLVILFIYSFKIKNIFYKFLLIVLALLVSFSRIYLFQHFFVDVYFGALIGTLITFYTIYIFEKYDLNNKQPFKFLLNIFNFQN